MREVVTGYIEAGVTRGWGDPSLEVTLNGEVLQRVFRANPDEGWVEVWRKSQDGKDELAMLRGTVQVTREV